MIKGKEKADAGSGRRSNNVEQVQRVQSNKLPRSSQYQITNPQVAPIFEVYHTHTIVAKQNVPKDNSANNTSDSGGKSLSKSRSSHSVFTGSRPSVTLKPHYQNNGTNSNNFSLLDPVLAKVVRLPNHQSDSQRSMSAIYKGTPKILEQQANARKPVMRPSSSRQPVIRQLPATRPIGDVSPNANYDSLNRSRNKPGGRTVVPSDQNYDGNQQIYYSLPRSKGSSTQNGRQSSGHTTKRILDNNIVVNADGVLSRKNKPQPIKVPVDVNATIATDSSDTNPINFSTTLAKAGTHSPPIKRRSSSLVHSPGIKIPSRFASRSTINDIYTMKNNRENMEKYKKVAYEILRENFAQKFGDIDPFPNNAATDALESSVLSSSSTSSATDEQQSISSIPNDDIPLEIPKLVTKIPADNFNVELNVADDDEDNITFEKMNTDRDRTNNVVQVTVGSEDNTMQQVDQVHLSDDDNESDEYDLDEDDDQTSSDSYHSNESEDDIENLKKMFIPLYEIERMDDDFNLQNNNSDLTIPDHQHSQSFRIENTSQASNAEVFVYKQSLQRAKDALSIVPSQGILSKRVADRSQKPKRRTIFDPNILLLDACLEPDFELVKELIPKVSDISKCTVDGITALHNAVCSGDARLVLYMLEAGANVNASDADGWTPLHCAACCNNKQISKILVEHGASLFAQTLSDYEIPSQKCSKNNQEDMQCEEYLFWEQENLGTANGGVVYALFRYDSDISDELPLIPNQILKVINTNPPGESGWFIADDLSDLSTPPRRGMVAAAYLSCYPLVSVGMK